MLGPALLMLVLTHRSGTAASLILNVEGVLTAVIAWVVFKENADGQIVVGMVAIVAGVVYRWGLPLLGHRSQSDAQGVDERRDAGGRA